MTRPTNAEELFVQLMHGMLDMRQDLHIDKIPTQDEMAAVWGWARRAADDDDLEHSLLENVMEGHMWADWQDGSIVFRLTPAGITHVEKMAADHGGSVEDLMRSMDIDPDAMAAGLGKRTES